jgi:hypothetical protein
VLNCVQWYSFCLKRVIFVDHARRQNYLQGPSVDRKLMAQISDIRYTEGRTQLTARIVTEPQSLGVCGGFSVIGISFLQASTPLKVTDIQFQDFSGGNGMIFVVSSESTSTPNSLLTCRYKFPV